MHKSKFLALLLAIAMVVSMVVVPVYAETGFTYSLSADKTTVAPGETFTVTLSLANNPGFAVTAVHINYDAALTISERVTNLYESSLEGSAIVTPSETNEKNPQYFSLLASADVTGNGALASYTFVAPAEEGTYQISLETTEEDITANILEETLAVALGEALTITVKKNACPEHADVEDWTLVNAGDWGDDTVITSGHYKLAADITLTAVATNVANEGQGNSLMIAENQNVCIDLNGHTIEALQSGHNGSRVFTILSGANLTIVDTTAKTVDGVYTAGKITGGMVRGHDMVQPTDPKSGEPNPTYTEVAAYRNDAGGNIFVQSGATFTLNSGIISDGWVRRASNYAESRGGNIYGEAGSVINIKGGEVKDGFVDRSSGSAGTTSYYGGGNIGSKGTVNISGGVISGGVASTAGSSSISYMFGGNIVVKGTTDTHAVLNITGGTIKDGTVTNDTSYKTNGAFGGNIAGYYADITITDATISGGTVQTINASATTAASSGGNIFVDYGNMTIGGTTTVSGGIAEATLDSSSSHGGNVSFNHLTKFVMKDNAKFTGGTLRVYNTETLMASGTGANIYCFGVSQSVNGIVEIHDNVVISNGQGGSKYGYAYKTDYYTKTYVYGGTVGSFGLFANATEGKGDRVYLYAGELTMSMHNYAAYLTVASCACVTKPVKGADDKYPTYYNAWQLNLNEDGYCATCDHTYANHTTGSHAYAETEEGSGKYACSNCGAALTCSNPDHADATWTVWNGSSTPSGHMFVNQDLSLTLTDMVSFSKDCCVNLNGHTVEQKNNSRPYRFRSGATVLVENGTLLSSNGGSGTVGYATVEGTNLTMKNVDIVMTGTTSKCTGGAILKIQSASVTKFEDCTFTAPGRTDSYGGIQIIRGGTHEFTNCTFAIDKAASGSALSFGVHYNDTAFGGTATLTGCTFIGTDEGANGGCIYMYDGTLNMTDCVLSGGTVTGNGGNIYAENGTLNMTRCTLSDGTSTESYGGNLYVDNVTGTFTDCTFNNGWAVRGGNLGIYGTNAQITVDGGTFNGSSVEGMTQGGNIAVQYGYGREVNSLTVKGGTVITGGNANRGGNVDLVYSTVDLQDCTITDGTALATNGGNVNIVSTSNAATVKIGSNVTVSGGTAVGEGQDLNIGGSSGDVAASVSIASGASVGHTAYATKGLDLTVEAGVTSLTVLPTINSLLDSETGVYTTKATLDAAIEAAVAGEGDTVVLGTATTADVNVEGYTLDLNGQTLTGNVAAADSASKVIDSSEGAGLVAGTVNLFADNGYLPVAVEGGYAFESVDLQQKIQTIDEDSVKLKFVFADAADETLLDTAIVNGDEIEVRVNLTWDGCEEPIEQKYSAAHLQTYASNWGKKMFTCTVSGVSNVEGLIITASVYNAGVQIAAADVTNN